MARRIRPHSHKPNRGRELRRPNPAVSAFLPCRADEDVAHAGAYALAALRVDGTPHGVR